MLTRSRIAIFVAAAWLAGCGQTAEVVTSATSGVVSTAPSATSANSIVEVTGALEVSAAGQTVRSPKDRCDSARPEGMRETLRAVVASAAAVASWQDKVRRGGALPEVAAARADELKQQTSRSLALCVYGGEVPKGPPPGDDGAVPKPFDSARYVLLDDGTLVLDALGYSADLLGATPEKLG
jgi:hypothetical protein